MKRKLFVLFITVIAFSLMMPGYSQDKKGDKKEESAVKTKKKYRVFSEVTLEDFENTPYTDKVLHFQKTSYQEGKVAIRDQTPAPTGKSKKYLGLKLRGKRGDVYSIVPAKEIIIKQYCKSISFWIYGKNMAGQLSVFIMDAKKRAHRIIIGQLTFLGWKKITIHLPRKISQQVEFLNQAKFLKILKFQYRCANYEPIARWHYFYMDDITAVVRDKYTDRQSDDW